MRRAVRGQIHALVGAGSGETRAAPRGDDGLFGPGSVVWQVHGDFTAMMIGGIAALLMQMLHPGALAGVWDHSDFRRDMHGRLRRTAAFIAGTTYGSVAAAEALIGRVRAVHDHVHGRLPDGTPYSANDPDLLAWVHMAEVSNFLAAHVRYRDPAMSGSAQDRYLAEAATIAHRLGAPDVPTSRAALAADMARARPALRFDGRTAQVQRALLGQPAPTMLAAPVARLLMDAAIDLLPPWAAAMHGLRIPRWRRPVIRGGVAGTARLLRWAVAEG